MGIRLNAGAAIDHVVPAQNATYADPSGKAPRCRWRLPVVADVASQTGAAAMRALPQIPGNDAARYGRYGRA